MVETKDFIKELKNDSIQIESVVKKCQNLLNYPSSKLTTEYVNQRVNSFSKNKYQFGYFPSETELTLFSFEEKQILQKIGVLYKNDFGYTSNFKHHTMVMPIQDDYGYYIGLICRSILDKEFLRKEQISKYKYSKFIKNTILYGLNFAKLSIQSKESVYIVEGQLDCISMHNAGFHNTVGLGGISISHYQIFLLKKYGVKKLYLVLDNEIDPEKNKAVEKSKEKMIKKLNELGDIFEIKIIDVPCQYKDIDEYLHQSSNFNIISGV